MTYPVSILDLTPIPAGASSAAALAMTGELARLADRLGYHRYWFAEHHNTRSLASAAPEIMIAHIAAQTEHLRLGSGGVMLPNHSPLKIIETFRLLEALHPGRIDLGLGRAPGTDGITAFAMRRSREAMTADDYPEQLAELIAYDDESFPGDHPFRAIKAIPFDVKMPPLWLLGSSPFSAELAAGAGLAYAFAGHINGAGAMSALRSYRASFVPSDRYPVPRSMLAVSVTVGETAAHAEQLNQINKLMLVRLRTGQTDRLYPTLDEAMAYTFSPAEQQLIDAMPMRSIVGDIETVHARLLDLAAEAEVDELMVTTFLADKADRVRTITSLAAAFGLLNRSLMSAGV
ncbi:MAG: LLM class flavin-dependent oxidoreductase [Chloroflexia bacterium]|nr:LLM class flavin-dependent oxidoreductase [Chloroflexia bacterium]